MSLLVVRLILRVGGSSRKGDRPVLEHFHLEPEVWEAALPGYTSLDRAERALVKTWYDGAKPWDTMELSDQTLLVRLTPRKGPYVTSKLTTIQVPKLGLVHAPQRTPKSAKRSPNRGHP